MESYAQIAYGFFGNLALTGACAAIFFLLKNRCRHLRQAAAQAKIESHVEGGTSPKSTNSGGFVSRSMMRDSIAPIHAYGSSLSTQKAPQMSYESDGTYASVASVKNKNAYIMKPFPYAYADKWLSLCKCKPTRCGDTTDYKISYKISTIYLFFILLFTHVIKWHL